MEIPIKKKKLMKRSRQDRSPRNNNNNDVSNAQETNNDDNSTTTFNSTLSPFTRGICPLVSSRYVKVGNRVGEGTYGVVYQALDKVTNKHVALKRCIPHHEASDGFPLTTLREIHTLKVCCQHPNIVDLLEIAVSDKANSREATSRTARGGVFLVFEYCPTDLANILDTFSAQHHSKTKRSKSSSHHSNSWCSPFNQAQVKTLTQQLLSAVDWCHQHYLIHRDIKPSNLLYSSDGTLKLCDFGLSRHCSGRFDQPPLTPNVVSLWYRAPELLFSMKGNAQSMSSSSSSYSYSFPIDMFSIGCVYCEILQGFPLLDGKTELEQIDKMVQCLGRPPSRLYSFEATTMTKHQQQQHSTGRNIGSSSAALWDRLDCLSTEGLSLATRLLEYDPSDRWTAHQALESPYFSQEPFPATTMPSLKEIGIE
ncbi:serine/threonine protein kinase [Nitzschia inconspicua]|uniref:Cyclin-dependent kinase 2 homolog n=1 Tax=Nitzschia inconspicua TaxID=303405 RepID=A0A9K3PAS6_9STRA|nr:serine/threonine protein kinase [Nitzschia inconspicua]